MYHSTVHKPYSSEKQTKITRELKEMKKIDLAFDEDEYYDRECEKHDDRHDNDLWNQGEEYLYW